MKKLSRKVKFEPSCDKTNNLGFRPCATQTGLYSHRSRLETGNFRFKKKRDCTICLAKTTSRLSRSWSAPLFSYIQIVGFLMRHIVGFLMRL